MTDKPDERLRYYRIGRNGTEEDVLGTLDLLINNADDPSEEALRDLVEGAYDAAVHDHGGAFKAICDETVLLPDTLKFLNEKPVEELGKVFQTWCNVVSPHALRNTLEEIGTRIPAGENRSTAYLATGPAQRAFARAIAERLYSVEHERDRPQLVVSASSIERLYTPKKF